MFVRAFVRPCVHHGEYDYVLRSVRLCTASKRLDVETPILARARTFDKYVHRPVFIQIVNVLDLHFKRQRFKLSTLGNSYVNTWLSCKRWKIGQTLSLPTTRKSRMTFWSVYSHLTSSHSKGQVQGHADFDWKHLANGDSQGQTLLLPTHRKPHVAFKLAYLHLTLAHSKGQGQYRAHFDCEHFANGDIWEKTLQLPAHRKTHVAFRFACLHLTLAHSQSQGQCQTHFDCEYLTNDKTDKTNITTANS